MDELVLSRGERFVEARTKYNKHGKQTTQEVAKATGVSASVINALENDDSCRSVGYEKVVLLAKHYGVTIDWLLELTNDPSPKPSAVNELKLSPKAINSITFCSKYHFFNSFFTTKMFLPLMMKINDFVKVMEARQIYLENEISKIKDDYELECDLLDEIEEKYPYLCNQVYVATGNNAIHRYQQDIEAIFSSIIQEIVVLSLSKYLSDDSKK